MDKYIGRLLDNRYEILEVIGTGGMSVVYKARCHRLNRLVAIKILKDDYLQDEEFRSRFHAESQAVAMLSHPNIVSVYDVSSSIMADYIVMELIDGISLKQYMETKGVLNWKETLHFGIQIAKALEHAHSRGIVHRDIKPHNVMVLKNGSVKVTDFGIARMMSKSNTLTKEALGSVHYISPEQAKGGRVDSRSDIYSLGVVMYEMMSGRPPYDGDSPVAVAIQHINGGAVMPSTLNPNIPGGLEQIIMKAMAHEIEDRYSSAAKMLSDMDEFRRDPAMLFDYNTPPIDAVTKLQRPPLVLEPTPPTAAERAAAKVERPRRQQPAPAAPRTQQPQRRRRKEPEEESSRVATIAIIACSVVAVIAIAIFLVVLFQDSSSLVTVPNLLGQSYEEVLQNDYPVKIEEGNASPAYHDTIEAGKIISQHPVANNKVKEGSTVFVTVSMGPAPKLIMMQDLQNMLVEKAREYLDSQSLNLQIDVVEESSDQVKPGYVIRTSPDKDMELRAGQKVTLYVSTGPKILTGQMIDVTGKTETEVRTYLDELNMNLQIAVVEESSNDVEQYYVLRSEPASGAELRSGQKVTLYVSSGPKMVDMPNLVGMNVGTASNVLANYGFPVPEIEMVESNEDKDEVISQSVERNTKVAVTTKINLVVSKGPAETQPPTTKPTEPVATVTKTIKLQLSEDVVPGSTLTVKDKDTGKVVIETTIGADQREVEMKLSGSGVKVYEIRINNGLYMYEEVDFTA